MITNVIKCKNCGADIEVADAVAHQIEEELTKKLEVRHAEKLSEAVKLAESRASEKAFKDFQMKLETALADAKDEKDRNKKLMDDVSKMTEELRALRRKDEERELLMKKTLADEETKIRDEARKKALEEHELKDREKDQNYAVALKQIEELKTKLQQGSQQAQGESLELALEETLRREFPTDVIEEVKKGQRGADIIQRVVDKKGRECGIILWESKNAQWSDGWAAKLREDQRQMHAHLAVIVATDPPKGLTTYTHADGVWITLRNFVVPLAMSLRYGLIREQYLRNLEDGKNEKKEELYRYITSLEFTQRMDAIIEAFDGMREEVEREKRWFSVKWARQEKHIRKMIDHMHGVRGDLQGVVGKALPEMKAEKADVSASGELPLMDEAVRE